MSENLFTDIFLERLTGPDIPSNRSFVDFRTERGDLKLVQGRKNLAQAVLGRLLTRRGELAGLGHPDYGSRLYELIGEPNTRRTRILAEHFIREALERDSRVQEVLEVIAHPTPRDAFRRDLLKISVSLLPVDEEIMDFTLTIPLEG